jgi:hypothetical protein
MNENRDDGVIRITREEATSSHVDDLLKRQMSMRGDTGVTRERGGRNWFYQNWFVLAIVGCIGAAIAALALEPFFDDMPYLQGAVTEINLYEGLTKKRDKDNDFPFSPAAISSIVINGERVLILPQTKELRKNGSHPRFDIDTLKTNETIGVYVDKHSERHESPPYAVFVERSPKPVSAARARLTLEQLKSRSSAAGMLLFPCVAGLIGLFIGAADGVICRLPRRALLSGGVGLIVGFVGGFIMSIVAGIVYAPLNYLAAKNSGNSALSAVGFAIQMGGRSLSWCLAGMAMGLGQGIALRSSRLLLYGFLGGVVGGLLGGLFFDPIDLILLGSDKPSAHWSRIIGFSLIGLSVGAMIGIVELLARDAWLRMTRGPLTGKEFLLFKDVMAIGASPRSDIYLFNDSLVAPDHAILRAVGDECEIEARSDSHPIQLNSRSVTRARLRHGDTVTIGQTMFVFQRRKG